MEKLLPFEKKKVFNYPIYCLNVSKIRSQQQAAKVVYAGNDNTTYETTSSLYFFFYPIYSQYVSIFGSQEQAAEVVKTKVHIHSRHTPETYCTCCASDPLEPNDLDRGPKGEKK